MMINTTSFADQLQAARDNAAAGQFDDAFMCLQRALDCCDRTEEELAQVDEVYGEIKAHQGQRFTARTVAVLFKKLRLAGITTIKGFGKVEGTWEAWA